MKPNDKAIEAGDEKFREVIGYGDNILVERIITAAYAAQFQSEEYAGLIARRKARGDVMTEPKWTPGPHFAEITRSQIPESEDADITYIITDKDKNEIVTFYNESAETFANAQLYAAASDLYAALEIVSGMDLHQEVLAIVDAAMRKARGE